MNYIEKKSINFRISFVRFFFVFLFLIITVKAVYLQVYCSPWLSQKAANQYEKTLTIRGKRGTIYDSKKREMAVSIDVTSIGAYPAHIKNTEDAAVSLASILNMDQRSLRLKLISRRPFIWIKRKVTPKEEKSVRDLNLYGIDFIPEHTRYYPSRFLAAQVLGFTGVDDHGLEGLEFYYDAYLKAEDFQLKVLKDALGNNFEAGKGLYSSYNGNNIILTIDRTIQYITEKHLGAGVSRFSAKSGMAVVMVPKTGAILAIANYPLFNPNSFNLYNKEYWRNRCITDPFEPGSTMKIFSAAAAIESGGCTPDTIFFCENGSYQIGKDTVHDTHSHGWLTVEKIIKYSSNIGAIKMGEMIGPKSLYSTLSRFGFGSKTGIDCPGETSGLLSPYEKWSEIDAGAISFGHGISASALQLVSGVSTIANKGAVMKPYIVQAITDKSGEYIKQFGPEKLRQAISEKTAETITNMMRTVVETGGTGVKASLDGYSVCGKTGTSDKAEKGVYTKENYIASFAGFLPVENPQLAIAVIIDEPQENHYGGVVAAPVFREIAREVLNYLNVPSQKDLKGLIAEK
ncbi:Putative peptidoglycan D,D-transpeptidase, PenA-like [Desulfonema limicola]|uniref:Peptidoglycan D,D-transpeptidase, PenA-like n=1 Tax=Desulfonema limicola TaxID=45656 RepID=A0A975BB79_9BACT|nr:penicillin-binding protein 2 [Desulfonema limicola]QTA82090.1 Putative peptidoglycan D,D-transpeptidase, PenA-like [Desulfonema limicola]